MPERYLGRTVGRFRMDALAGSGGFAWVYKGYDPELDIPVAIKVLKPQFAGEADFEARFRREASIAAKLRHPNIIRILAVGHEADAVFFVMDFLPTTLDERLRTMKTLPESLLVRLGMDVSGALAFAHREAVIHRDIKTDNILFDAHGNAVVADFGIARAMVDYVGRTGTNMVVGTPQYFSPEQARGLPLDGRADIYSLGVTLFKAATGVLPFQGSDWYEIARQQVEDTPPGPRELNPALSREAERIILKCLEKDPARRYSSGEALRLELAQLFGRGAELQESATVVLPSASGDRWSASGRALRNRTWLTRKRLVAAGAVSVGLLLALSAAALRWRGHTGAEAPTPTTLPPVAATDPVRLPVLHIDAPPDADVGIDGTPLAPGAWDLPSRPGEHHVVVRVPAVAGCGSAREDSIVLVLDTGVTRVSLTPRACGYLAPDIGPAAATWAVTTGSGTEVASGTATREAAAVLPVGAYSLRVSAPYCATYRSPLAIRAAHTSKVRVRLLCGAAHR